MYVFDAEFRPSPSSRKTRTTDVTIGDGVAGNYEEALYEARQTVLTFDPRAVDIVLTPRRL